MAGLLHPKVYLFSVNRNYPKITKVTFSIETNGPLQIHVCSRDSCKSDTSIVFMDFTVIFFLFCFRIATARSVHGIS